MIEFHKYAKIKDHYCVCYFGPSDEYLLQLKVLKPVFENRFPGLKIYFGCRDDKVHLFDDNEVMKISQIKLKRHSYAHIKEISFNGVSHPIEDFLNESGIVEYAVGPPLESEHTSKCLIVTEGCYPTKNLEKRQIESIKKMVSEEGYQPEIGHDVRGCGLVVGVESFALFDAASKGIRTRLVPTGIGTRLYRKLYPNGIVMHS